MANSDMIVRVQADTKNYDANLAKASKTLKQFADNNLSMSGVLKQTTSALTGMAAQVLSVAAAIGAAKKVVGDMVRINMQFEQGTANLASIIGKSREEISALTTQAKQLGATTRYTAMQITELQTNLARLGFTEKEILNSTSAVQAFATATGADLGEAANLAGAALRGFGLNATEMERVASVLSVSTTKSALSFEKLATAVPIVAPVAKQFGFTIEDTVTLLAKLSDAGMDASTAATATRNIFLKMANDSGKLSQALGRPVHSVEEFGEALKEMRDKGMSLNDILSMVGVRSTAAFAVFADNAETLKDFKQSITDCGDAMHDMENKQIDTLQGSITILNSAWEGLMLSFSESNGVIKTVVDNLSELLQTWTKWRNRNAGGDAAIKTYELSNDETAKLGKEYLEADRKAGMSDSAIKKQAEAEKAAIEEERDAMHELLVEWEKAGKLGWGSKEVQALMPKVQGTFKGLKGNAYQWAEQMQKQIAQRNDNIAVQDYMISALTAPAATTATGSGNSGSNVSSSKATQLLKAQYEEQEKAQIAALDRMAMNEADYEAAVYKIKRETLQKIADLYQDETAEKARANAAISDLDIRYQGTQMRLANKSKTSDKKATEEYTGTGEYSQKAVDARMSQAKKMMDSSEFGSERYLYEADKIVDLTTLQNLMSEAVKAGMTVDPEFIKEQLGRIDMGLGVSDSAWEELVDEINAKREELDLPPIELDVKTGNVKELDNQIGSLETNLNGAISVFGQLGDAMQQIDDPGAKVAGIIMGAIANIAGTFAKSLAGTFTPWDWIAAAISGTATMISTIAAIKSATSGNYASGGIIPGNSFSGDNMRGIMPNGDLIGLDAGEVILNRAQQGTLASQLQGNPMGNMQLETRISGTDMLIFLNNTNRSLGGSRSFYSERH